MCRPQVPFVRGGVEIFTDRLVEELRARGIDAEIVSLPFRTWPNDRLATSAMLWRLVDLSTDMEMPPDVVIATKFPSYLIKHPVKVVVCTFGAAFWATGFWVEVAFCAVAVCFCGAAPCACAAIIMSPVPIAASHAAFIRRAIRVPSSTDRCRNRRAPPCADRAAVTASRCGG